MPSSPETDSKGQKQAVVVGKEASEASKAAGEDSPAGDTTNPTTSNNSGESGHQKQQQQQQPDSVDGPARGQGTATATATQAQLSAAFSSPKQQQQSSVNRKEGGLPSSASNSPRQIRSSSATGALNIPPPKPPRDDGSRPSTPIASPSNASISSKNTVKTGSGTGFGFGQHKNRMMLEGNFVHAPSSLETGGNSGSGSSPHPYHSVLKSQPAQTRGGATASPKQSPMSSSARKAANNSAAPTTTTTNANFATRTATESCSQQQQGGAGSSWFSKLDHPPLPLPRKASKCPLFCCFYAEFDNVVGPKICFQSPIGFMEQDTDVSLKNIHKLLATNFDRILAAEENNKSATTSSKSKHDKQEAEQQQQQPTQDEPQSESKEGKQSTQPDKTDQDSPGPASPQSTASAQSTTQQQIKKSKSGDSTNTYAATNTTSSSNSNSNSNSKQGIGSSETPEGGTIQQPPPSTSSKMKETSAHSGSKDTTTDSNTNQPSSTRDTTTTSGSSSTTIFDSTSDFIITGNELTGNIVNLSAFNMHLLTRPTMIHDQRYERNSLLFCVGFVLRRSEDPRPFRPLLSKLALTLKRMEMESHFLSVQESRQQLQPLLDRVLVSLNCTHWETNLVVHNNVLNLKLFHPPKYPASPVPDHAVPILLRRDWQVQLYDWDLAINWVVLHIDGVANARQISRKAEVDMEMVRNCLRVLKHHSVISLVDMFFYSNRYESTHRAAALLAGHEPSLLQEAADYVMKRPKFSTIQTTAPPPYSNLMAPLSPPNASPTATLQENFVKPPMGTVPSPGSSPTTSSYPPGLSENVAAASLLGSSFKNAAMASYQTHDPYFFSSFRREEQRELKAVLGELYCACNRNLSFGDLWVALASEKPRKQSFDRSSGNRDTPNKSHGAENRGQPKEQGTGGGNAARGAAYNRRDDTDESGSEGSRENIDPADMSTRDYYFERLRKKSSCAAVDWRDIFDLFDHRRFVSFGLVNGLLERVHNYPCILEPSGAIRHRKNNSCTPSETFLRRESSQEPDRLARNAAAMMDGSHCDDDIVSIFQKPIHELVEMVEKYEGKKVLPIYSVAMDELK